MRYMSFWLWINEYWLVDWLIALATTLFVCVGQDQPTTRWQNCPRRRTFTIGECHILSYCYPSDIYKRVKVALYYSYSSVEIWVDDFEDASEWTVGQHVRHPVVRFPIAVLVQHQTSTHAFNTTTLWHTPNIRDGKERLSPFKLG